LWLDVSKYRRLQIGYLQKSLQFSFQQCGAES
jgi:hypothetical protein